MAEMEQTQVVTRARETDLIIGDRLHCLELSAGDQVERRHVVSPLGLKIGRTEPAEIVIPDTEISRSHCMVVLKGDEVFVTDLGSTNGTFVDGEKISGMVELPLGSVLQVGNRFFKHECRTRAEFEQSEETERELNRAANHVKELLPPPTREGPLQAEWMYQPSIKLGGDAFGYGQLNDHQYVCYLVDVSGNGTGAAMHSVSVVNHLRHKSLPNTDMAKPEQVLGALNELYQMEDHAGLYFTIWYGVFDTRNRRLDYASGGQHPAYLVPADRSTAIPLQTRNVVIGAMPTMDFRQDSVEVPPGASCYLFSDGVFEIVDKQGAQWTVDNFVEQILRPPVEGLTEPYRLFNTVRKSAQSKVLEDDFALVVVKFD